jgi:glycosyltransferase involved in cell wall biosynthesis
MKISAAIITLNEERNILRCLESLRCCDEIVVVDSGSQDRTVELATQHGAKVVHAPWPGYAKQKNFASESCQHEWVLSLDADEALSEALEAEIWQLRKDGPRFDAYDFPRLAQYLGRWIRHSGWYPDRKIRLYRKAKARWVGNYVHESVQADGSVGHLENNLLHFTCDNLSDHLRTMDRYTKLAAEELRASGKVIGWRHLLVNPLWTLLRTIVVDGAWRDGQQGLTIAWMAAFYNFLKYARARDKQR